MIPTPLASLAGLVGHVMGRVLGVTVTRFLLHSSLGIILLVVTGVLICGGVVAYLATRTDGDDGQVS